MGANDVNVGKLGGNGGYSVSPGKKYEIGNISGVGSYQAPLGTT